MRHFAAALLLALAACGGGAPPAPVPITPSGPPRTDLLFGYFAQDGATAVETQPHTNMLWTTGDPTDQMAAITFAAGRKVVLQLPFCLVPVDQGEAQARFWFQRLHAAGLLAPVVAVSWCDEPNTPRAGSWTDAAATQMNAAVRQAMGAYPELHAGLAVIYACNASWPGFASFDWIGCDDYDSGCAVLSGAYVTLLARLSASQRAIVLPGGADPWRQDPACFLSFAERTPTVAAIVPFIWQTVTDGRTYQGIRVNGMAKFYCQAGRTVTAPGQPDGCT